MKYYEIVAENILAILSENFQHFPTELSKTDPYYIRIIIYKTRDCWRPFNNLYLIILQKYL